MRHPEEKITLLAHRVIRVAHEEAERISKHSRCLIERHAVFLSI